MSEPIHILSLGAGVQSSTLALMAAAGEVSPMPKAAIFADTQAEPASVYRWLDWLEKQLPFPVRRTTQGDIAEDALTIRTRKDGKGSWSPSGVPHFTIGKDGSFGQGNRQCTADFKLAPIAREQRRLILEHGLKISRKHHSAVIWIGISLDEQHRMKASRVRYVIHRWPLIDLKMRRDDCLRWMRKRGFPEPPRSACVFCPYHSDSEWRRLKTDEPEEFARAIRFEKDYQEVKSKTVGVEFVPFLHRKRIPLDQVDFDASKPDWTQEQLFGMGQECEGMCGV